MNRSYTEHEQLVRIVRALSREHQIRTNGPNENGVLTFNSYAEMSRFFGYDGTDKYGSEIANVMRYLGEIEIEAADIVAQGNKTKSKAGTVIWFEEPVKSRGGRPSGASRGILIRTNSLIWSASKAHDGPTADRILRIVEGLLWSPGDAVQQ